MAMTKLTFHSVSMVAIVGLIAGLIIAAVTASSLPCLFAVAGIVAVALIATFAGRRDSDDTTIRDKIFSAETHQDAFIYAIEACGNTPNEEHVTWFFRRFCGKMAEKFLSEDLVQTPGKKGLTLVFAQLDRLLEHLQQERWLILGQPDWLELPSSKNLDTEALEQKVNNWKKSQQEKMLRVLQQFLNELREQLKQLEQLEEQHGLELFVQLQLYLLKILCVPEKFRKQLLLQTMFAEQLTLEDLDSKLTSLLLHKRKELQQQLCSMSEIRFPHVREVIYDVLNDENKRREELHLAQLKQQQ